MMQPRVGVLFVCMGNICRSPTAEGVFNKLVLVHGLANQIKVDSAGTHAYHVGEPPDVRAIQAAQQRNYDLSALRARKVQSADLQRYDYVLAMDRDNLKSLRRLVDAGSRTQPELLLAYHPDSAVDEVPDPYYGGSQGFDQVLDLIEPAALTLLKTIVDRYQL